MTWFPADRLVLWVRRLPLEWSTQRCSVNCRRDHRVQGSSLAPCRGPRSGGWHVPTGIMLVRPGVARRVGIAGSASWLAAHGTASLKPLIGRRRLSMPPTGPGVASASMPSTHAASAAAAAAGGLVQQRAAIALLIPAGGVAWSRLRTRRHYVSVVAVASSPVRSSAPASDSASGAWRSVAAVALMAPRRPRQSSCQRRSRHVTREWFRCASGIAWPLVGRVALC
jgi:membrane-associated phospholipid phosphatase